MVNKSLKKPARAESDVPIHKGTTQCQTHGIPSTESWALQTCSTQLL